MNRLSVVSILFFVLYFVALPQAFADKGDGIVDPGENEMEELARAVQNPVASLISLPIQNNTNFDFGPQEKVQNVTNIQPVLPFEINEDWNLITRTIVPVINQPAMWPGGSRECGLGDTNFTMFLSPVDSGEMLWGFGPSLEFPTATEDVLGTDNNDYEDLIRPIEHQMIRSVWRIVAI